MLSGFKYRKDRQNQAPGEKFLEEDVSFPATAPVPWCRQVLPPQLGRWLAGELAGPHVPNTTSLTPVPLLAGIPGCRPHLHTD